MASTKFMSAGLETDTKGARLRQLGRYLPFLNWLLKYKRADLPGDLIAGLTVATMLVPQSMAYALLAGLPPYIGLYASILPVLVYGLLGSTRMLTLGPTAITSVMVLGTIGAAGAESPEAYMALSLTLALFLGIVFILMGMFRLGFIVNLLSQPVLAGYVNAAALIIIFSQIPNIAGIRIERSSKTLDLLIRPIQEISQFNPVTFAIGVGCIGLLFFFKFTLKTWLEHKKLNQMIVFVITRSGPLVVVIVSTLVTYVYRLDESSEVRVIGEIPAGFPALGFGPFDFSQMQIIIPGAFAIAFVGFMEGISTAKSLMSRRRELLDPNQELLAMGVANFASVISGGLAVTTSISRSAVSHAAGARTGLASVIAAICVGLVVTFFTPLFYYLPQAALAAIIMMAVANLVDPKSIFHFRRYSKGEPIPFVVTFLGAFFFGIEVGILGGIVFSALVHLYRTIQPPIIRLERIWDTEEYRDAVRYDTQHIPAILIMRVDESLYFANAQYLERFLRDAVAQRPEVEYLILVCNAINTVDASAILILIDMISEFKEAGIEVYLAEMKDRVRERVDRVNFSQLIGEERFFNTTHEAVVATGKLPDDTLPI